LSCAEVKAIAAGTFHIDGHMFRVPDINSADHH
jgi:hypothetical protein